MVGNNGELVLISIINFYAVVKLPIRLSVKDWCSIVHLILDNDANRFESDFVFLLGMAERLTEAFEELDSSVEALMPLANTSLEVLQQLGVHVIWGAHNSNLVRTTRLVSSISHHKSSRMVGFHFLQESVVSKHSNVVFRRLKRAVYPHQFGFEDVDRKLILQRSVVELV